MNRFFLYFQQVEFIKQKMKISKYVFIALSLFFIFSCMSNEGNWVIFQKVIKKDNGEYIEKPVNKEETEFISIVLREYDEDFKLKNGNLLIKEELYDNKELMRNYCTKAGIAH